MQLLTPPSAHREVVQKQALEQRAVAAERRADALTTKLEQERLKSAENKREELRAAQREREAYLANVRSLFQMSPEQPCRREESGCSEAADGGSAAGIKGGPSGRAVIQRRGPPPVPVPVGNGGIHGGGSTSSSSSSNSGSARTGFGHRIHAPVTRKSPASTKFGQPAWSEISTAAPSTAGGCDDDFEDLLSVVSGAGNLISPRPENPVTVDLISRAAEPSELLQSLDLQVGNRLRASLKNWLEAQDDTESEGDSPSPRRGKHSNRVTHSPPLTDPLGGLPVLRSGAELHRGRPCTGNHMQTSGDDLLGESLLSLSASERQPEATTSATPVIVSGPEPAVVASRPAYVCNTAAAGSSVSRPAASELTVPRPEAPCGAPASRAPLQLQAPSRSARPAEERKQVILEPKILSKVEAPAQFQAPSRAARPPEERKQVIPEPKISSKVEAPAQFQAPSRAAQPAEERRYETSESKIPPKAETQARAPQQRSASSGPSVQRALRSKSPTPVPTIRAPPLSMKAIVSEEEALQKSLMRLEFQEMRRQFSGKEPLWDGPQVMSETLVSDPHRESKLKASLDRLGNVLSDLQARHEVRSKEHEQSKVDVITAPPSQAEHRPTRIPTPHAAVGAKRLRPRSASVGRVAYGNGGRPSGPTAGPSVPTPHAGVRAVSAGRCKAARPPDSGRGQDTSQESCQPARAAVPSAGGSQAKSQNGSSATDVARQRRANMQAGRGPAKTQQ